ncbi:MAG: hypothetical protein ACWGPS_09295 [Candidatus Promineifilaceae bacterium]
MTSRSGLGSVNLLSPSHQLLGVLAILLLAGCVVAGPAQPQPTAVAANGIPIASEFQAFYEQNGGVRIFGYPVAEPYGELKSGRLVQYFERMRLEFDPQSGAVQVTPLGAWALPPADNQRPAPVPESSGGRAFPGTELTVQDEFLTFYEGHGGERLFGPPLSPQLDEGGTRTQYFENVRLEWHPEAPLDYRVQIGLLGEAHYREVGLYQDPGRSRPLDSAGVREAKVAANVSAPILYGGEQQILFVDVLTPDGRRPVVGVQVEAAVSYDGKTQLVTLPETDGEGHSQLALPISDAAAGQRVQVDIAAYAPGGPDIAHTSVMFKIWW